MSSDKTWQNIPEHVRVPYYTEADWREKFDGYLVRAHETNWGLDIKRGEDKIVGLCALLDRVEGDLQAARKTIVRLNKEIDALEETARSIDYAGAIKPKQKKGKRA